MHNRIHKVLEDASIKLDTVASDILGTTGRAIIEAIIAGEDRPDWLAANAQGTLRSKRNQRCGWSCAGRFMIFRTPNGVDSSCKNLPKNAFLLRTSFEPPV